jgi:hypothetical protein
MHSQGVLLRQGNMLVIEFLGQKISILGFRGPVKVTLGMDSEAFWT